MPLDPVEEHKRELLATWVLTHFDTKAARAQLQEREAERGEV